MATYPSKFLILSGIVLVLGLIAGAYVFAAYDIEKAKQLTYPIGELGNCGSFDECKVYCNKDENIPTCNRFAITHGLLTKEEAADTERLIALMDESGLPGKCENAIECFSYCESVAHLDECWDYTVRHNLNRGYDIDTIRRLAKLAREGVPFPGNCQGKDACEAYCENPAHIDECLAFAEKAGLFPPDELAEAKKVAPFIKSGETPGGCKSKNECEAYCTNAVHMRECIEFGEKIGILLPDVLEQAKKILPFLERGETPGKCTRKDQCEAYCSTPSHMEECIAFAEKTGILQGEELEQAKKVAPFLARGETPGGCTSKDTCESYCQAEGHMDECIAFGEKTGMMTKEEAEMARKTGGKGPGDCKSKEECETFCSNPANQQTCMDFMKEHGIEVEGGQMQAAMEQEVRRCGAISTCGEFMSCMQGLQEKFGGGSPSTSSGSSSGEEQQQGKLPSDVQAKMDACIAELRQGAGGEGGGGGQFPSGGGQQPPTTGGSGGSFSGPGGCKSQEECTAYCTANPEACQGFSPPSGVLPSGVEQPPQQVPAPGQYPSPDQYPQAGGQIPQEYCSSFASVPSCSYVGEPDSQNYKYCKQCYPDK